MSMPSQVKSCVHHLGPQSARNHDKMLGGANIGCDENGKDERGPFRQYRRLTPPGTHLANTSAHLTNFSQQVSYLEDASDI
jgi:hypothetical protein